MSLTSPAYLPCPCCGFPSITTLIAMTCSICWWEADGPILSVDEPSQANHGYTLRRARENFARQGHMYDEGREIAYLKTESEARRALLAYVRQVQRGDVPLSQARLNELISAENDHMRAQSGPYRASDAEEEAMLRAMMAAASRRV